MINTNEGSERDKHKGAKIILAIIKLTKPTRGLYMSKRVHPSLNAKSSGPSRWID